MRLLTRRVTRLFLPVVLALLAWPCQAEILSGRVVHVADGDTITILDAGMTQHKVRLAGIDAPERSQPYGRQSRDSLAELVADRVVIVEVYKRDRYGRHVGKVLVNEQDVNIEQIRRGLAWFYRQYKLELSSTDQQSYDRAEAEARELRRGLWADRRPIPPWDFRLVKRQK